MLSLPLPEDEQAQAWTPYDIKAYIEIRRLTAKECVMCGNMDKARTEVSAVIGLRSVLNLKQGKTWNDGFK